MLESLLAKAGSSSQQYVIINLLPWLYIIYIVWVMIIPGEIYEKYKRCFTNIFNSIFNYKYCQ